MRSLPACWNNTLTKLGFKRKRRRKQKRRDIYGRRSLFEGLEQRQMLTSNTVVVDTDVNVVASDGLTSLQEAFDLVAADSQLDTITFDSSLAGKTITYPASETISSEVSVIGPEGGVITLDAHGSNRFFLVTGTGDLTLKGLALTGGNAGTGGGGAITNFGEVSLDAVTISDSHAPDNLGGAIFSHNPSLLSIVDSTFHGNSSKGGGAIVFVSTAENGLSISRTTFYDNKALTNTAKGGALQLAGPGAQAKITNSTFSANSSEKWGGAIQVFGTSNVVEIINSTITNNSSVSTVGGLRNSSSGTVTVHNTVIAGNHGSYSGTVDSDGDISGDVANPSSNNFLGVAHSNSQLVDGENGNQLGTAATPLDPLLLPLAESTPGKWTHAPDELSPLINAGSSDVVEDYELSDDQRGSESQAVARVYDELPDVGAYESGSQPIGLGESFVVNDDHVTGSQNDPWVATNRFGQTIVVWFGEGPEGTGLYTQIVNTWSADPSISNSTSLPRLVDAGDAATPIAAQVAIDDFGNYSVAWTRADDGDYRVAMRRYRADGTAVDALPVEVSGAINYATPPTQTSIVTNRAGRLLVTWREPDGDLKFRRYTTLGLSLDASPQQAASTANGEIVLSTSRRVAAVLEDGSFFMQWGQRDTNDKLFLKLQRYSPAGTRADEPLVYASDVEDNIPEPSFDETIISYVEGEARVQPFDVVTDAEGGVVVAWLQEKDWDDLEDGSAENYTWTDYRLFYRRYNPTDGWSAVVEVATGRSTFREEIDGQQGGPSQTFYRFATSYDINVDWPGLATDDAGRVGIAWGRGYLNTIHEEEWQQGTQEYEHVSSSASQRAFVRWFDRNDQALTDLPIESPQFFSESGDVVKLSLAADGQGDFLLTGHVNDDIHGQRFKLPNAFSLDNDGTLKVEDFHSNLEEIVIRSQNVQGKRYVVFNDLLTNILTEDVQAIRVQAGAQDNFIDLGRVSSSTFPNLNSENIEIYAGPGDDEVHASKLGGMIDGEQGDDRIFGNAGSDEILGGEGNDTISGRAGDDVIRGGAGNDTVRGGLGADQIWGDAGDDRLLGNEDDDTIDGGADNDYLDSGTGLLDTLLGGAGDDTFALTELSAPLVTITDTEGVDTIDLSQAAIGATLELQVDMVSDTTQQVFLPAGQSARELQINAGTILENVTGSDHADTLEGNQFNNSIIGGYGDDELDGLGGDDLLDGGAGTDTLRVTGGGQNELIGGTENDIFEVNEGVNRLVGGAGDDTYKILYSDTLDHEFEVIDLDGVDKFDFSSWTESVFVDLEASFTDISQSLRGADDTNIRLLNENLYDIENISGGSGDDILFGHSGDNELNGGAGTDKLEGRGGRDIIVPGEPEPHVQIIDDSASTLAGVGWESSDYGYQRNQQQIASGTAGAQATWSFTGLEDGAEYEIYVTWNTELNDQSSIADNVAYSVQVGSQAVVNADSVNQRETPASESAYGVDWHGLSATGTDLFQADTAGTIEVVLDAAISTGGLVFADAVRLVKHNYAPTFDSVTLNGSTLNDGDTWNWNASSADTIVVTAGDVDTLDGLELVQDPGAAGNVATYNIGSVLITPVVGNPRQWTVQYTPDATNASGTFPLSLRVVDDANEVKSAVITLLVKTADAPTAPTIDSIGGTTDYESFVTDETRPTPWSVTVAATSTASLSYALGPNAPVGADIDLAGVITWSPTEDQNGEHVFDVLVTDDSLAPQRTSQTIKVTVNEVNDAPQVDDLKLKYYPNAPASPTPVVAYPDLIGTVSDDESVELLEVEVDYDYDGVAANFVVDEVVSVTPSEFDPTTGTFEIKPSYIWFTDDTTIQVGVRAIETDSLNPAVQATPVTIEFQPDFQADTVPTVTVSLVHPTGTATDLTAVSFDPAMEGAVTNAVGPVEGLSVRVYSTTTNVFAGETLIETIKTDEDGKFSYTPTTLNSPTGNEEYKENYYWFVAEEQNPFEPASTDPALSVETLQTINYAPKSTPTITSLGLLNNTGDPANDSPHDVTRDATISGQIDEDFGYVDDVLIEFSTESDFSSIRGTAITDETGAFEFRAPGLTELAVTTIYARAVVWDDYLDVRLVSDGSDSVTFVYDKSEHDIAQVSSLTLKYENGLVGSVAEVVDPTVQGTITNDGELAGVLVEFAIVDDPNALIDFTEISGSALTDENGEFEFTPPNLDYGTDYFIYARTAEFDAPASTQAYSLTAQSDDTMPVALRLSEVAQAPLSLTNLQLAYDTATPDDFVTAHPTVVGTVSYAGNMANVIVEIDLDGDLSSVEGYAMPDEETGEFEFTPINLPEGEFTVQAWLRVPNFGTRLPEFEDNLLDSVDGELVATWFENGYNNEWTDTDGDGIPDANEDWLNSVFASDGVTLNEDASTVAGQWFTSDFDRDWSELFTDLKTEPQTVDNFDSEFPLTLDLSQNNDPTVTGLTVATNPLNPTITGSLLDDGPVGDVLLEFYWNGREVFDGSVRTESDGTFSYTFSNHTTGQNDFEILVYEPVYDNDFETIVPPREYWLTQSYTLDVAEQTDLLVDQVGLKHEVDDDNDPLTHEAIDSTLVGRIDVPEDSQLRTVEFDLDDDGFADAYSLTRGDGSFEFTPIDVAVVDNFDGTFDATIHARVVGTGVEVDGEDEIEFSTYGAWTEFQWTILENLAPEITHYELAYDTGNVNLGYEVLDRVTSDPTIIGRVVNDNGASYRLVEFDYDGDGFVDSTTATDQNGSFRYEPAGLALGRWDIRARVTEVDTRTGELLGSAPEDWRSIEGVAGENTFVGFTLVEPAALNAPTLDAFIAATKDPTITGTVTIDDSNENLTVEFYLNGSSEPYGSTTVDRSGSFEFTPAGLDFSDNHQFEAKVKRLNYLTGEPELSTASNTITLDFNLQSGFGVSGFNRETSNSLLDLTLTGTISSVPTDVALQYVEIVELDGADKIVSSSVVTAPVEGIVTSGGSSPTVAQGFRFQPELSPSSETVKFRARAVGVNQDGFVFGSWSSIEYVTYDVPLPTVSATQELDDQDQPITTSNTIEGTVALPAGESGDREIDIDFDGDGVVDDTIVTELGTEGNFAYQLADAELGQVEVWLRGAWYHTFQEVDEDFEQTERIESEWQLISFDLVNSAPSITWELAEPVGATAPANLETYEPTIAGTVSTLLADVDVAGMTVEVDRNADGIADQTTTVYLDGTYELTLDGLTSESLTTSRETVTLRVRAVDRHSSNETLYGDWQEIQFDLLRTEPPVITSLSLETDEDIDPQAASSSNPVLVGSIAQPPVGATQVLVEFSIDGGQSVEGAANVDLLNNFRYVPNGLPYGATTITARTVVQIGTETLVSDWYDADVDPNNGVGYEFQHKSIEPAVVNALELTDANTATIAGRVTVGGFGEAMYVEVQVVGSSDPEHNFTVRTNRNGYFEFSVPKLIASNSYDVEVRGVTGDPNTSGTVSGEWRALAQTFTYTPSTVVAASVATFQIAFDTGADTSNTRTNDATLRGTVNQWQPQLYVEIQDASTASVIATVPVLPDGSFKFTPDFDSAAQYTVRARTKLWDPHSGNYVYEHADWTLAQEQTFHLDASENDGISIPELNVVENTAQAGQTQQTSSPTFKGRITNDGNQAGLTVEFDHNGDGIIDGAAITKADGSFFYRAVGIEPSNATQTITATVTETDFAGNEFRSAAMTREFILSKAPLIKDLKHVELVTGPWDTIYGKVVSDLPTTDLMIEYQLFGEGAQSNPPDLENYDPGTWTPSNVQSTTVSATYGFSFDTQGITGGPALAMVRGVGNGVVGPWLAFQFTPGGSTTSTPDVQGLGLSYVKAGTTQDVSDPELTGSLDNPGIPESIQGAYGIVEFTIHNLTDTNAPELTFRTSADKLGDFAFTPSHLAIGSEYKAVVRSVVLNPATGQEQYGTPSEQTFTLVADQGATVVFDPWPTGPGAEPIVSGKVSNPDGRLGGLRVEFDFGSDGTVDHVEYTTVVDGEGVFSFTPAGLSAGQHVIDAQVTEWDPTTGTEKEIIWDANGTYQNITIDLQEDIPEEPALEQEINNEIEAGNLAEESFRDAIFSLIGELGIAGTGDDADMIDLGIGKMELLHKGGAGDISAEAELSGAVFVPETTLSAVDDLRSDNDFQFFNSDGDQVEGEYSLDQDVTVNASTFTAHTVLHFTLETYSADTQSVTFGAGNSSTESYSFEFYASGFVNASGDLLSATYEVDEIVEFAFFHTEIDGQSERTTIGDYHFHRSEGDTTTNGTGTGYTSTIDQSGAVDQKFSQTETVRLESWFEDNETETSTSDNSTNTRTSSVEEHIIVESTTTVTNGNISSNSSGLQSADAEITFDVVVTADSIYGESNNYTSNYEGGSESGNDNEIVQTFYEGSFYVTTVAYEDGGASEQSFDLSESSTVTITASGTGTSTSSGTNRSSNESWNYGGTSIISTGSEISGNFTEQVGNTSTRTTLDATIIDGESVSQNTGGFSTVTYSNGSNGNTDTGNGNSSFSSYSVTSNNRSATINSVDDVYTLVGQSSSSSHGTVTQTSSGSGTSTTYDDDRTDENYYSSVLAVTASGGGSIGREFTQTEGSNSTTISGGTSVSVTGSTASQSVGTITEGAEITTTRGNSSGTFGQNSSQSVLVYEHRGPGGTTRTSEGYVSRGERSDGASTSFYSGPDGFSLSISSGASSDGESFDFTDSGTSTTQTGSFSSGSSGSVTQIAQSSFIEGDTSGTVLTFNTAKVGEEVRGTFESYDGSISSVGSANQTEGGASITISEYATVIDTPTKREATWVTSGSKGFQSQQSGGIIEIVDGETISLEASGNSSSSSQSSTAYSGFTSEKEGLDESASSYQGHSLGFSSINAGTELTGNDGDGSETVFRSVQGGRARNSGSYSSRTEDATTETSTFSQSQSKGQQLTRADGSTEQNGRGQQSSFVASITSQGGEGSFYSLVTTSFDDGDESTSTRSTSRGQSASSSGSSGTSKTDTAGRTTIKGSGEQASRGQSSSTSRTTVYHTNGSSTTVSGRSKGSSSISTQGRVESDHNHTRERGSFTIGSTGSQTVTVTEKGGSSGSSSYGRTTSRSESKSSSSVSGSGSYERDEDHRDTPGAGKIEFNTRSGDGSGGGSGNNTNSNNNNGNGLDTQSTQRDTYDNTITSRSTGNGASYESTIRNTSYSSASSQNGSINSSVGSTNNTVATTTDLGFTSGVKKSKSVVSESSQDRTFMSEGGQPGDNQSLTIESSNSVTDEEKTEYEVYGILALGAANQSNFGEAPISSKTVTTEETRTQSYNANHNLGSGGAAVGGKLNASSNSSSSTTTTAEGDFDFEGTGDYGYTTKGTEKLEEFNESSRYVTNLTEESNYGNGSFSGSARSYVGFLNSASHRFKVTNEYTEEPTQSGQRLTDRDQTEGKHSVSSHSVARKHSFDAQGTNVDVSTTASSYNRSYTDNLETYHVPDGDYYLESQRLYNDHTYTSNQSSDQDSSWYESRGVSGEYEHGDYPPEHPLHSLQDEPYHLTYEAGSDLPKKPKATANRGPANPGTKTVRVNAGAESSAYPGGIFNPGNWLRALYTGDASAPDNVYAAARNAAGESAAGNKDTAINAIDAISTVDPTPLSDGLKGGLEYGFGDTEAAKSTAKYALLGPLGDLAKLGKRASQGSSVVSGIIEGSGERLAKQADNAGDLSRTAKFSEGAVVKGDDVYDASNGQFKVLQEYCFAPETLVATPTGPREIREIRQGDTVLAYDHQSGLWSEKQVEIFHENIYEGPLHTIHTESGPVRCTDYHPFWVVRGRNLDERSAPRELEEKEDEGLSLEGRWVNSHELRCGDVLVGQDGQQRTVLKIEQAYVSGFAVHNLTINEHHTYAVGTDALLVHNTGGCTGRTGKQARLRELLNDPNVSRADKGWIKQELNAIDRGKRNTIRVPIGKNLAHKRGFEARKGFGYEYSDLQDIDLHRLQHSIEGYK